MDHTSSEESDISDSDINDYVEEAYEQLKAQNKVKAPNGTLRCPFCLGKKKQDYKYKELIAHAAGVGKGSANRSARQKVNHLALAKYLQIDLAAESDLPAPPVAPPPLAEAPAADDRYVWPWMGVVVNITSGEIGKEEVGDETYWLNRFAKYKPQGVHFFSVGVGSSAIAIVKFNEDWDGFMNAEEFERAFATYPNAKEAWKAQKTEGGSGIYGWRARSDDFEAEGPIGDYLRNVGQLKSIGDIVHESTQNRHSVVAQLAGKIDLTNETLNELQYKYNERSLSLKRMLEEKDKLHNAFFEGLYLSWLHILYIF